MKYLTFLAGVFLAVAASAPAQAQPGGRERAWGAERQQQREFRRDEDLQRRQQDRMTGEQRRPGRLTPEERQQRHIRGEERRYMADGQLSPAERADLQRDLNRSSRHIYNEKHDNQQR